MCCEVFLEYYSIYWSRRQQKEHRHFLGALFSNHFSLFTSKYYRPEWYWLYIYKCRKKWCHNKSLPPFTSCNIFSYLQFILKCCLEWHIDKSYCIRDKMFIHQTYTFRDSTLFCMIQKHCNKTLQKANFLIKILKTANFNFPPLCLMTFWQSHELKL